MPRLLVPLLTLKPESASGVAFARGLLPELARAWDGELVVLGTDEHRRLVGDVPGARWLLQRCGASRPARLLATRRRVPRAVAEIGADLVHVPDGQLVPGPGLPPTVVALHHHLNYSRPQGQPLGQRLYWKLWYDGALRRSCARAAALVAPSHAFAREFVEHVPQGEGRVHVIPHGVGSEFRPEGPRQPDPTPHVLVVGNASPYKNVETAVAAFARAGRGRRLELRLAGIDAAGLGRIARRGGLGSDELERVRPLGRLPQAALPALYRGAAALLFPSRVESFGLPVLEAMASGTPVVASDLQALRELSAGAATLVPADDVSGLATALERVLDDEAHREGRVAAGIARAGVLSWERCARRTAALALALARERRPDA